MIRSALENRLKTITPSITIQYENAPIITPVANVPYCTVNVIYGGISDEAITNDNKKEMGLMQVTLFYPTNVGAASCEDRARLIRETFKNGLKLTHGNDTVIISKTADIKILPKEADRFIIAVSVYWKSYS